MKIRLFVLGAAAAALCACASVRQPCPEPEQVIVTVKVPEPCVVVIEALPPLELPTLPPKPPAGASDEAKKAWALSLGQAVEDSLALCVAQDSAWRQKVLGNNAGIPKCSEPPP